MTSSATRRGLLTSSGGRLAPAAAWRATVRRYALLDTAAVAGAALPSSAAPREHLRIPGYGPSFGLAVTDLARAAVRLVPALTVDWEAPGAFEADLAALRERGFAR